MATSTRSQTRSFVVHEEVVVRFDRQQRLQHFIMMSTFIICAITGLPQKFHDATISQWWVALWGGVDNVRTIHRSAAILMGVDCFYHIFYMGYGILIRRKPFPVWMLPQPKDIGDFFGELRHWFGLSRLRPRFDRFSWREKFDYFAVFWGIPMMGVSGLVMMFPVLISQVVPNWLIPVSFVAHSDEAILAVGWIVIVHFFNAHLAPNVFPFNSSIFTGKVPVERYREEHPLEFARMTGEEAEVPAGPETEPRIIIG